MALLVVEPRVAVTVLVELLLTGLVVMVKLAWVLPVLTVTEAGVLIAELLSLS